jgi:hypothetical protein
MSIEKNAVDQAAESLDVLANAVTQHEVAKERERASLVELLREVEEKIGPLMLRFRRRIEEVAPHLVTVTKPGESGHRPGGRIALCEDRFGSYGVSLSAHVYVNGCPSTPVLGWDGKIAVDGVHLNLDDPELAIGGIVPNFVACLLGFVEQLREQAVKALETSEKNRAVCLTAAAEIRRLAVTSALGSARGGW